MGFYVGEIVTKKYKASGEVRRRAIIEMEKSGVPTGSIKKGFIDGIEVDEKYEDKAEQAIEKANKDEEGRKTRENREANGEDEDDD